MIQLIMDTGMRLGETLSLVIDAIDLDRRVILIPADITKVKKKICIFWQYNVWNIKKRLQFKDRYINNDILMLSTTRGTKLGISHFGRNFRLYKQRTGLAKNIIPHSLRNNFAKRCLMSGIFI